MKLITSLMAAAVLGSDQALSSGMPNLILQESSATRDRDVDDIQDSRVVVKLRKLAPKPVAGMLPAISEGAFFYVASALAGQGEQQQFDVQFDISAGNVMLPSNSCKDTACLQKKHYRPRASARHINVNGSPVKARDEKRDGVALDFTVVDIGDGTVEGELIQDSFCIGAQKGKPACVDLGIVSATFMDEIPFAALPFDGMVGLGLASLTVGNPMFSFPHQLAAANPGMLPQFSLSYRGSSGELSFGGLGPSAAASVWRPVYLPEEGYWQVRIEAVRVGNRVLHACAGAMGCRGILDTSSSRLGVPAATLPSLMEALAVLPTGEGCTGPELHLDLEGGYSLTLQAEHYAGENCGAAQLAALKMEPVEKFDGAFVLGAPVLGRYDTVYDWEHLRIGFSPSSPKAVRMGPPVLGMTDPGRTSDAPLRPEEVVQI